tara:strand:+ start:85 stop:465 length:381 start_codon:yes stop_codon:yes gene_type:complete
MEAEPRYELKVYLNRWSDVQRLIEHIHDKGEVNNSHTHMANIRPHTHLGQNNPKRYRDVEVTLPDEMINDLNDNGLFLPMQGTISVSSGDGSVNVAMQNSHANWEEKIQKENDMKESFRKQEMNHE